MTNSHQQPAHAGRSPRVDEIDRWWLLTWTTYRTWLPGDRRGFVSPVADESGTFALHNVPGTPYDQDHKALEAHHTSRLRGRPVFLTAAHAASLVQQFHETTRYRERLLVAAAVMREHVHLVVGDPEPADLLRDFKAYGSRRLNRDWQRPECGTWWTESGSKRKLKDEEAVLAAVAYVRDQNAPLVTYNDERFATEIETRPASGGH